MQVQYVNLRRTQGGTWYVTELADDGWPGVAVEITDPDDTTAGTPVEYDARCASCKLGHAHSLQVHARRLERACASLRE